MMNTHCFIASFSPPLPPPTVPSSRVSPWWGVRGGRGPVNSLCRVAVSCWYRLLVFSESCGAWTSTLLVFDCPYRAKYTLLCNTLTIDIYFTTFWFCSFFSLKMCSLFVFGADKSWSSTLSPKWANAEATKTGENHALLSFLPYPVCSKSPWAHLETRCNRYYQLNVRFEGVISGMGEIKFFLLFD